MDHQARLRALARTLWDWRVFIGRLVIWYVGLVYVRDELQMGEFYLLASGFWLIYLVGFSPRQPGELSAYAHFNAGGERLLGDMDPTRVGRELTGQAMFDDGMAGGRARSRFAPIPRQGDFPDDGGYRLGSGDEAEEDRDLQRALLLSLRAEREARKKS